MVKHFQTLENIRGRQKTLEDTRKLKKKFEEETSKNVEKCSKIKK